MINEKGQFVKGHLTWNKGTKGVCKPNISSFKSGANNKFWKGGIRRRGEGYVRKFNPNHPFCDNEGYIYQHRFVIEQYLGRLLKKNETIHHLGKKNDNRLKKLMCFISHSAHMRFHYKPNNVKPEEINFDGRQLP